MSNSINKNNFNISKLIYKTIVDFSSINDEDCLLLLVRKIISKVKQKSQSNLSIVDKIKIANKQNQKQLFGVVNNSQNLQKNFFIKKIIENKNILNKTLNNQQAKQIFKSVTAEPQKFSNYMISKSINQQNSQSPFDLSIESEGFSDKNKDREYIDCKINQGNRYLNNISKNSIENNNNAVNIEYHKLLRNNPTFQSLINKNNTNENYIDEEKSLPKKNIYRDNYLDLLIEAYDYFKDPIKLNETENNFEEINTSILLTDVNYSQLIEHNDKNINVSQILKGGIKGGNGKIFKQCENKACTFIEYKKSNFNNFQNIKINGKKVIQVCNLCYKAFKNKKYCFYCGLIYKDVFCNYNVDLKTWVECDFCNNWQHVECEEQKGEFKDLSKLIENKGFKYKCFFCRASKEESKKDKRGKTEELKYENNLNGKKSKSSYLNEIYEYQRRSKGKQVDGKINPGK